MWLSDVKKMLVEIEKQNGNLSKVVKSIKPSYDSIIIETSYFTIIKYNFHTGELIEKPKHEWEGG